MTQPGTVVATAGHVDHGKSSLILRLTGMDPDRWAEEKRRGLTIDLGFAWCELPSGREIGFVDVPGHERFIRNMLAGVGPVRLVLFVVAADEGWKPQSEEHLAIIDVLGTDGGVVAITKRDAVDDETLGLAIEETSDRLRGTALESSEILPVSSVTGDGIEELLGALDRMVAGAPAPDGDGRPRQFVDRVFTIKGAGTVITGTLTGGPIEVGREVELYPTGAKARVRGLQSHQRTIDTARPVSRVAANLVGVERARLERGDVLGLPGQWRPTTTIETRIRPIRGLDHSLTPRGSYKLYAGSAERDARVRFYGGDKPRPSVVGADGGPAYARIRLAVPLVLEVFDRFVLREAGRRETVAGGIVLDIDPPTRPGADAESRLARREAAERSELPAILIEERGAVRADDVHVLTGVAPREVVGATRVGAWWIGDELQRRAGAAVDEALSAFHGEHPLQEGAELSLARAAVVSAIASRGRTDPGLVDALLDDLAARGSIIRTASEVRLATHTVELGGRSDELDRLVAAVSAGEPTPPTIPELVAGGFAREMIEAVARQGLLARISPDLVVTANFLDQARQTVAASPDGITVSAFREALGTSRKYAVPLLEYLDQRGVTVRRGDVRVLRGTTA